MIESEYVEGSSSSLPSFNLNGISLQLPATPPQPFLSPPRSSQPKKRPSRRNLRPSTAPTTETSTLLPAAPAASSIRGTRSPSQSSDPATNSVANGCPSAQNKLPDVLPAYVLSTAGERLEQGHSPQMATREEKQRLDLGLLPSPFIENDSPQEPILSSNSTGNIEMNEPGYDWGTFITAYAQGRWDPQRTPKPPRSYLFTPAHLMYPIPERSPPPPGANVSSDASNGVAVNTVIPRVNAPSTSCRQVLSPSSLTANVGSVPPEGNPLSAPATSLQHTQSSFCGSKLDTPLKLPPSSHRIRNSLADLRSSNNFSLNSDQVSASSATTPELTAAAATMRWAAACVKLAPLSLPSPERELTDPMHGVTAAIPGSHSGNVSPSTDLMTPGGSRKTRLGSFWKGTQDVEEGNKLVAIDNSSNLTLNQAFESSETTVDSEGNPRPSASLQASVPVLREPQTPTSDYFGDIADEHTSVLKEKPPVIRRSSTPLDMGISSVPALPRRVCLTRQTSSPLPVSAKRELSLPEGRVASQGITSVRAGRAAKEEQMFAELGYLAPPNPPDELERRRALYKFNIFNTGADMNFDRIAHLAKLVFSTKGVVVSLIDGNEQWFKSEWGMQMQSCARIHSFCAHSILQRGDEPTVVLDTLLDWRFAKNPLVTEGPHIRFYAGAPLRTQDGFSIGSLGVIDDAPRQDFSPRQRHTLKEFAAIAMREMELWRDKIQLRIRDRIQHSMEQFSRECLEIDTDAQSKDKPEFFVGASMDKVYDRAAKLVKRTLDVEGAIVVDVSHCEVLETVSATGSVSVVMHHGDSPSASTRTLSADEYGQLNAFFSKYPDGKISEGIVPPSFRPFLPTHIQYALTVPVFNVDKRPFALLCAYNGSDQTKRFLEGHELSYLRAIGVIILSAVLKRRMILADKAKSLFISNISHELRTPLHGILAAAELLTDSPLNYSQISFLQTVQACGTSLVETVNHVLDFTKLSGNSKAGGVENVITPSKVDLMQLVEEAVDGCWIGYYARTSVLRDSEIGSVYSPPKTDGQPVVSLTRARQVETIVDIGKREGGWTLSCEKGGIRRILMNLLGNSLKFTSDGFVHVSLRQLPHADDDPPNKVKIELSVVDTGKGISQNFLKNQLFHPFSQENPLQTGTGLGLAIVNSIVQSESVGGKVDVWSEEGVGTEIKVTFMAETSDDDNGVTDIGPMKFDNPRNPPTVSLVGFEQTHQGTQLLLDVLTTYLVSWWGFEIQPSEREYGDIVIVNDNPSPVITATERRDTSRSFVVLSASRGNPTIMTIASDYERIGGFCRIVYKPSGPSGLRSVLKLCLHTLRMTRSTQYTSTFATSKTDDSDIDLPMRATEKWEAMSFSIPRRNSEESNSGPHARRPLIPRSSTAHPTVPSWRVLPSTLEQDGTINSSQDPSTSNSREGAHTPTISIGSGGTLLESSVRMVDRLEHRFRVLVVEDNTILRNLLIKWLGKKGYDFRDAEDGQNGVEIFEQDGPFDIVLLDLSMPVLDGIGATTEIRKIESAHGHEPGHATRILALTGMSSLDDKRRAFEAGVDGYLVKPVAFKTLDEMFHKLGIH